ncbi:uncharacterized protein LOC103718295 isoform X3 [Phoenix dactylifera]|uniref:Uncharacterized protein LOC103718295 isoform X3 n=1 Tax=Phoenix dactylifera TaxID=42345 RepID=A0A8B9ACT9_PHODC|nr:uncharacterized protein LOC103718295 isoform X3 [Phoenix dactylifera]
MRATAIDLPEALRSPSPPSSHFSPGRHYHVAVDRLQFKMVALLRFLFWVMVLTNLSERGGAVASVAASVICCRAGRRLRGLQPYLYLAFVPGNILQAYVNLFSSRIMIGMVVGGEVVALKELEESSCVVIAEMPINECLTLYLYC